MRVGLNDMIWGKLRCLSRQVHWIEMVGAPAGKTRNILMSTSIRKHDELFVHYVLRFKFTAKGVLR